MFLARLCAVLLIASSVMAATDVGERDFTRLRTIGLPGEASIYIFTSAGCPHCATFHRNILPEVIKKYSDTGRAQIFLVDDASTSPALEVSMLARCLPEDKSEIFMTKVFENQSEWIKQKDMMDRLIRYAVTAGMTKRQVQQCLSDANLRIAIQDQWANLSHLYHIEYLPTIAVRRGNSVRTYTGANKAVLNGMEFDFQQ